jgi:type IV pilus assembly protein PilW
MNRLRTQGLISRQYGFSLLELLIATSIGMVITVGAIAVFANSTGASKTTEAQSRMNEDAQAALSLLSREIKMAGYNPIIFMTEGKAVRNPISAPTLRGCSGMLMVDANSANDDKLTCEIGVTSQPHSLVVRYEADFWNTLKSKSKELPTDCLGAELEEKTNTQLVPEKINKQLVPEKISYFIAENRYYIGTSQVIRPPSLYCKGNGGLGFAQPMIENIEDLKFSFGTATMPAPAPIAGYLSATEVEKLASSQPKGDIASAWNQVRTVQICIVVRSEAMNLVVDNASSIYTKCDGTQDASQIDRRLRRAYTTTVYLRNHK